MGKVWLETIKLENGLDLKLYDDSRRFAGDRWLVALTAKIEIPVADYKEVCLAEHGGVNAEALETVVGDVVTFKKKYERTFVAEKDRNPLIKAMRTRLLSNLGPYLSRSDFPVRCISKQFKTTKNKRHGQAM